MKDFEIRLVREFRQTKNRLDKLNTALAMPAFREKVGDKQFELMTRQAKDMNLYLYDLSERMKLLGIDADLSKNLSFGEAIEALKDGHAIAREGWNGKDMFIVKQVPAEIGEAIIPNMQSLPQSAKDLLLAREDKTIRYTNQMLLVQPTGRADSWVASSSDTFAEDWFIVR